MLRPAKIVVHLHDVIENRRPRQASAAKLSERVHEIIAEPVNALYGPLAYGPRSQGRGKPAPVHPRGQSLKAIGELMNGFLGAGASAVLYHDMRYSV